MSRKLFPKTMHDTQEIIQPTWTSNDWLWLRDWLNKEIQKLREQNDVLTLDERTTTSIRAKIAAFKQVVDLQESMRRESVRRENTRLIAGEEY